MTTKEVLFYLLRNEIKGERLPDDFNLTEDETVKLYRLSKRHDLAHLIGDALFRVELLPKGKVADAFKRQISVAVLRYEQQNAAFERIRNIFNMAKISFVPLKGVIVRQLYPKPWMRTSCDVDILIHEEDIERATKLLNDNGFDTGEKKGSRHLSFYYGNFHLELHFHICENNERIDELLTNVWDYTERISEYEFGQKPEFFVLYHIVHMTRHVLSGGCGVRPFIDLFLLREKEFYREEELLPLLEKIGLIKFYRAACGLADVWMNGEKYDELTLRMEKYVLEGGVYGTAENANTVGAAASKGRVRYILRLTFLPYSTMCVIYPSLKKHKILLPFYYIHRIFVKLFGRGRKRAKGRISMTMAQSDENLSFVSGLLDDLELKK